MYFTYSVEACFNNSDFNGPVVWKLTIVIPPERPTQSVISASLLSGRISIEPFGQRE